MFVCEVFQFICFLFCYVDDFVWEVNQFCDVNVEVLVIDVRFNFVEQCDFLFGIVVFIVGIIDMCCDVQICDLWVLFGKGCEFVEMCSKYCEVVDFFDDMFRDGLSKIEVVIG